MKHYQLNIAVLVCLLGCSTNHENAIADIETRAASHAVGEWPNWHGPAHNGLSEESGWRSAWEKDEPKIAWKANVGIGFSSVSVADGKLYTMGHAKGPGDDKVGDDTVWCLDARTGKEIWKHTYKCEIVDNLHEGGPATTPTVDEGRVFTISKEGDMFAFDADSGKVLWEADLSKRLGVEMPKWGFSCSPLVLGEVLIVEAGRTVALDKKTGETIWQTEKFKPGYGSAAAFEREGKTYVAVLNNEFLLIVNAKDGEIAAKFPWTTSFDTSSTTPIVHDSTIYVSTAYNKGCALFDFNGSKLKPRYSNQDMRNHMATCVLYKDYLYGFDGKAHASRLVKLVCMDYKTGKVQWAERGLGCGSLMIADGKLIALSDQGELVIAPASPDEFKPTGRMKVVEGKCWTVPVLAHGMIYCRTAAGELAAVDVKERE